MRIIGEKLNSSIPSTLKMLQERDDDSIIRLMQAQQEAGADFLDLNAALMGADELPSLKRLVALAMEHTECGIVLDSPNAGVLLGAAEAVRGRELIFNSVTACERIDEVLPAAAARGAGMIALPMKKRMPEDARERVEIAEELIERMTAAGLREEDVYIDCIVEALSAGDEKPRAALDAVREIRIRHPKVHLTGGISNVSFGLPARAQVASAFLAMAMAEGLDSPILDITSPQVRASLQAALALNGEDEFCMGYIRFVRQMQKSGR
jgi:5-methyltetrahydrofolate--homocysteine methyltransferase